MQSARTKGGHDGKEPSPSSGARANLLNAVRIAFEVRSA